MIISREKRHKVYRFLYNEGVLYAEEDFNLPEHPNIPEVSNLEVIRLMKTFTSKKYVKQLVAWRHIYWFLTNEGIQYIREYLSLPEKIVPKTLKQTNKSRAGERRPMGDRDRPRAGGRAFGDERAGYRPGGFGRGGGGGGEKPYGAPGQYEPQFAAGGGADKEGRWDANK